MLISATTHDQAIHVSTATINAISRAGSLIVQLRKQ